MLPLLGHPDPFYLFRACKRTSVLDPDTGAVAGLAIDHLDVPSRAGLSWYASKPCYTLSLGHRKVLRITTLVGPAGLEQLCDVLTLGGDQRCWRRSPSPPICIMSDLGAQGVVIQGFAYFMADKTFLVFTMVAT
ncbi:hypothetical protein ZWY2020_026851 [Hordeum vulgare]|nr:hypothetical protein ZWY2020_026851 [Hordeum vulgare]